MRISPSFTLLAILAVTPLSGWAAPNIYPQRVKETVYVPHGWVENGEPSPDHNIVLRIGLPQPNFAILEKHLYEVSDPSHYRYGAHLSKEETESLVAPNQESIDAVNEWLESHGIKESDIIRSPAKDWVTLTIPISLAEKMLGTKYNIWRHTSGDELVRTTSYSLPENLHEHVDVIQPTTMFGRFRRDRSTISWPKDLEVAPLQNLATQPNKNADSTPIVVDPSCNSTITIRCLQQLYNAVGYVPKKNNNNSIGITGSQPSYL
ncbi:hypothetical protein H0H81_005851 [Sphagnurus paluster]|uniref:Peptidase S53 activation domain-containing protein n=1 Tax=Sphagnurus paluster TaxID=117069 RepID=A0A9P7FWZ3_9AGAR|nr:hypothetical protein H0H81_005851 [Sphagnurus paluster]